jgi:hypothetical protein
MGDQTQGSSKPAGLGDEFAAFTTADFALLEEMADGGTEHSPGPAERVDALWAKAERLVGELGAGLFGAENYSAAIWPDSATDERLPFIWARLKRVGNQRYATHIGLFLSPGFCNLSIDLEKDPLDAGESAETLEQVVAFFSSHFASISRDLATDLRVWTDTRNVVGTAGFAALDFDRFMADNHDADHPWPKVGYMFSAADVAGFAGRWVEEYRGRAAPLVPIYDAMIQGFGR